MQSRWGLDCNLMSSMILISIYMMLKAKNKIGYLISGIFWGITFYSYALSYFIVSVLLILLLLYMLYIKKIKITDIICLGIPIIVLALPLILNLLVNKGLIEPIENVLFSTPKLWHYRGNEISLSHIAQNFGDILIRMFGYDTNDYNAFKEYGTLYYISIPFFIIGFITAIKNSIQEIKRKELSADTIFIINFICVFICLLLVDSVGVSRANGIYIPTIYFVAIGIYQIIKNIKLSLFLIVGIYIIQFLLFQYYYFGIYGKENTNASFNQTTIDVVKYIENEEKFAGKTININTNAIQPYIYTLLANETSPYEFNKDKVIENGAVYSYGRYRFYNHEIDDNTVYVIVKTEKVYKFRDVLVESGFTRESYKNLEILYKTIEQ